MATRRDRNADKTVEQHLHAHDDDLDDGQKSMNGLRRDIRTVMLMVGTTLVAVIGALIARV